MSDLVFNLRIGKLHIQLERGPWLYRTYWVGENGPEVHGPSRFRCRLRFALNDYWCWTSTPWIARYQ